MSEEFKQIVGIKSGKDSLKALIEYYQEQYEWNIKKAKEYELIINHLREVYSEEDAKPQQ